MQIRRIRFRKEYRLKGRLSIIFSVLLCLILIPRGNRALIQSFFSTKCRNHQQVFSKKLNDRLVSYMSVSRLTGIEKCADENDIRNRAAAGELFKVRSSRHYLIEDLSHSYPYLTGNSKKLLKEIGRRFQKKIGKDGLKGSRFIVTSLTRTTEKIKGLGRSNINVSDNSPHLDGNAFDISYARFSFIKFNVTECDKWYMKEALAEVIYELKMEKKCWATYEKQQGCFHIVSVK